MPAPDGKYCTVALLKKYLIGSVVDPANPTRFNGNVSGTPDDDLLSASIFDAESTFEQECDGTAFDQATQTVVQSFITFIDGNGWLHLFARERGPVTAVAVVEVRDLLSTDRTWKPVTWTADDIILPPYSTSETHPHPESWHVLISPVSAMESRATGQIMARWTYTGGYPTIPTALSLLIASAAAYVYQRRENAMGVLQNAQLGTFSRPLDFPPDILRRFQKWSPVYG